MGLSNPTQQLAVAVSVITASFAGRALWAAGLAVTAGVGFGFTSGRTVDVAVAGE